MNYHCYPNEVHVIVKPGLAYSAYSGDERAWVAKNTWVRGVMAQAEWANYNAGNLAIVRLLPDVCVSIAVERTGKQASSKATVIRYIGPNKEPKL